MRRSTRRFTAVVALAATALFFVACDGDPDVKGGEKSGPDAKLVTRDARPLGPGDVSIMTEDRAIELALVGDSIVTGLGPAVLDKIRDKTDTGAVAGNGFGAGIEKMVKSTVATAMSKQLQYPLSGLQDVRYENGRLEFFSKDGSKMKIFEGSRDNGKPIAESFDAKDAQRFVDAVHARMASTKD